MKAYPRCISSLFIRSQEREVYSTPKLPVKKTIYSSLPTYLPTYLQGGCLFGVSFSLGFSGGFGTKGDGRDDLEKGMMVHVKYTATNPISSSSFFFLLLLLRSPYFYGVLLFN